MAPSPITCRCSPSAARLLRVPAPAARVAGPAPGPALGLGGALPRRHALVATRVAATDPWVSARAWVNRSRREEATRCAAAGQVAGSTGVGRTAGMEVALGAAAVVAMGTGNRVLYKLALVPLRNYPFFLAQFATFGRRSSSSSLVLPPPPPRASNSPRTDLSSPPQASSSLGSGGSRRPPAAAANPKHAAGTPPNPPSKPEVEEKGVARRPPTTLTPNPAPPCPLPRTVAPAAARHRGPALTRSRCLPRRRLPKMEKDGHVALADWASKFERYVAVYFSILYLRYQAGIVNDEMMSLPQKPFLAVGLLEAFAAASGMAAGAVLSGASIPILSQTYLVWQLLLSAIFLKRRYRINEIAGCFLVAVGVIITVATGSSTGASFKSSGILWPLLMIISFFLQAADTVLKEIIFINASKKLKCGSVDLFVVNSYGSAYQALFMCLLLPFLSKLWGVPFHMLPAYIKDGAACFLNMGSISGCEGAPLLPLLFVIVNMGFNISLLHLLKISSAVVSSLASTFSVPLSIYAFTLPLPYMGAPSSLPPGFVAGAAVLTAGLLLYSLPQAQHSGNSFHNRND